jgi:hypothetical protein
MTHIDVFNGDADGICSIVQLRLAHRVDSLFVTGAKRDIRLVERVNARSGDQVTVLDVSLAENRDAVERLLAAGARVEYFDHHYAGDAPPPPGLVAHLDASPGVCTGMLVDHHLAGRQRIWAVVAAFGDNLLDAASEIASSLPLTTGALAALKDLGDCLTYNTYGEAIDDAIVRPDDLVRILLRHADPLRFVATDPAYAAIDDARRRDLVLARSAQPTLALAGALVYVLPDAPWARRIRGIVGNELANANATLAHAVVTTNPEGDYAISIRAPRAKPMHADALARQFATGGGRAAAAGINHLPRERLNEFVARLAAAYPGL